MSPNDGVLIPFPRPARPPAEYLVVDDAGLEPLRGQKRRRRLRHDDARQYLPIGVATVGLYCREGRVIVLVSPLIPTTHEYRRAVALTRSRARTWGHLVVAVTFEELDGSAEVAPASLTP